MPLQPRSPSSCRVQPDRAWCRYYQAMSLARQQGRWSEVARLADAALSEGSTPEDVSEWMPGLEAYETLGRNFRICVAWRPSFARTIRRGLSCACSAVRGAAYAEPYDYNQVNAALCQAN